MTIIEKIFALKKLNPFDRLRDSELSVIAEVATERKYVPGEIVTSEGRALQKLYMVVDGQIIQESDGRRIPAVFGVESLLFDIPTSDTLKASSEEATCLMISKRHFFTLIYECPELLLGLLETEVTSEECFRLLIADC